MLKYNGRLYRVAQEDEEQERLAPEGAGKKFQLSEGQVDVLSQVVMLGIAILMKQGGITTKEQAREFDFSQLLQQAPQMLRTVAADRQTLKKEVNNILRFGPDRYIAKYIQLLRNL